MQQLKLAQLSRLVGTPLPHPLYHAWGLLLHDAGEVLEPEWIDLLAEAGFDSFLLIDDSRGVDELVRMGRSRAIAPDELREGMKLSQPVYDDQGVLLLGAGSPVTRGLVEKAKALDERGVRLRITRDPKEVAATRAKVDAYHERVHQLADLRRRMELGEEDLALHQGQAGISAEELDASASSQSFGESPGGPALLDGLKRDRRARRRVDSVRKCYLDIYREALAKTGALFEILRQREQIQGAEIAALTRQIVELLVEDRELLLNLTNLHEEAEYLTNHAVNSSILAANIATELGLSRPEVNQVGFAGLLADVGMLFLPRAITDKPGKLSQAEWLEVQRHPGLGLDCLASIRGFPTTTPFVVYQCHERQDRSGYPKQRPGHLVARHAQIVALADVYDALTSRRPYRDALLPYEAMETVVRMVNQRKLDKDCVRAFLSCMSLFPIGSWVLLDDQTAAKVISANSAQFTRPVVSPFLRDGERVNQVALDLSRPELLERSVIKAIGAPGKLGDLMTGF